MEDVDHSDEFGFVDEAQSAETIEDCNSDTRFADELTSQETNCPELAQLSRDAGIDPSSLTDVQIVEALYQLR